MAPAHNHMEPARLTVLCHHAAEARGSFGAFGFRTVGLVEETGTPADGLSNECGGGLMLVAMALAIALHQGTDARVVEELREFELRLAATWQKGDCSAWSSMLAPEWSVIHITGDVITKEKALGMCRAPRSGTETVVIEDVAVRVFGDAAVVIGRTTASAGDAASRVVLRFTDVFIRREGQWRVVASQATEVRPAKSAER